MPQGLLLKPILIKLDPQIGERDGRIVGIGNSLRTADPLLLIIENYFDLVVCSLLPVFGSRGSICSSNLIGIRKELVDLPKRILGVVPSG